MHRKVLEVAVPSPSLKKSLSACSFFLLKSFSFEYSSKIVSRNHSAIADFFLKKDHLLETGHFCKNFGHLPKLYSISVPTDCPRRQIQVIWCIVPGFISRSLRWHLIKYLITFHNLIDVERFLLERWNKMIVFNFNIIAWYRNI
jgi:hypothetical protein